MTTVVVIVILLSRCYMTVVQWSAECPQYSLTRTSHCDNTYTHTITFGATRSDISFSVPRQDDPKHVQFVHIALLGLNGDCKTSFVCQLCVFPVVVDVPDTNVVTAGTNSIFQTLGSGYWMPLIYMRNGANNQHCLKWY